MNIHPTSIISPGARLGANVSVGPYTVIEQDTDIGESSDIRAHVVIKRFTTLGPANTVHEGAVLGGEPQDIGFVDCTSYLRMGSNNRIRECVTIHRGAQPESATIVGSNCFIKELFALSSLPFALLGANCRAHTALPLAWPPPLQCWRLAEHILAQRSALSRE